MSYTFQFESEGSADIKSGDRCEFYAGFPATVAELVGEADPMASTTLNSSFQATLSSAGSEKEIAIVLKHSNSTYARSNSISLSKFTKTGVNKIYLLGSATEVPVSELQSYVPSTPYEVDGVKVTTLEVSVDGSRLRVHGEANAGWAFFDFSVKFDYWFTLVPNTVPIWTDDTLTYLSVKKDDFKLTGKNILQDVNLIFEKGAFRRMLEAQLNRDLNDKIDQQTSKLADIQVTVESAKIGSDKVSLSMNLVSLDSVCPLSLTSSDSSTSGTKSKGWAQGLIVRDKLEIWRMRAIRDTVLAPSASGRQYIEDYSRHRAEVFRIVARNEDARRDFYGALRLFLVNNAGKKVGEEVLTEGAVAAGLQAITTLSKHAGSELASSLEAARLRLVEAKDSSISDFVAGKHSAGKER